jgi:hypothetical protein
MLTPTTIPGLASRPHPLERVHDAMQTIRAAAQFPPIPDPVHDELFVAQIAAIAAGRLRPKAGA